MDSQKDTVNFMRIHVLRRYKTFGFWLQRLMTHGTAIIIIIIIIIIICVVTFMQGIYNCITETTHVPRVCSVTAVLCSQFVLHVMVFRM
jgi:hypothetical protein